MKIKFFIAFLCLMSAVLSTEATIKITSFLNESPIEFNTMTDDGRLFAEGLIIDKEGATLSSKDGKYQIILEDADKSGFHRPHWKFHVWVKMTEGFPFLAGGKVLHSVFFYDGLGEMQIRLCPGGKLFIKGGRDVLNPWKVGTIGRGNPYHKINHDEADENGVAYFDGDGFVAYPYPLFAD